MPAVSTVQKEHCYDRSNNLVYSAKIVVVLTSHVMLDESLSEFVRIRTSIKVNFVVISLLRINYSISP